MKKTLFAILALSVAIVSCTKENEVIVPQDQDNQPSEILNGIPETITGIISDTRTAYADDGDFTWANGDQVRLIVAEDLTTYSRQGIYTYMIKSLSDNRKSATFTSTSTAGDLTAFVDGTWKSTGFAMYPTTILDRFNTPEGHSYGTPWFTLARGSVSGAKEDIILVGVNDESISNFRFYTAMSVLKVTLNNIPASAAAVKLCTSDKTNYPVDGDFSLSKDDSGKPAVNFISTYASGFNGYQKIDLSSQGEIASVDYYFNIPAAAYPANTLSILIEDANGGQIFKRTINKALTLAKNDCLSMPALTYSHTVAFKANCTASAPYITWTIDSKRVRFCVSTNSAINISEFIEGYKFTNNNATGNYSSEWALSSYGSQKPSATGQYYLHYIIQSDAVNSVPASLDAANVVAYGTIPFYYLSSDDAASFAKQYTFTKTDNVNFWHPGTGSNYATTMTLAVSDDVTRGNLMISEIYGKTGANKKLYGVLSSSDATSMTFAYNGDASGEHYFYQNGNYFHVAQGATHDVAAATGDIEFTIASGPVLTCENYLMMKYTASYTGWNEFISGVGLVFN